MVRSEAVQRMAMAAREKLIFPDIACDTRFLCETAYVGRDDARIATWCLRTSSTLLTPTGIPPPSSLREEPQSLGTSVSSSSVALVPAGILDGVVQR